MPTTFSAATCLTSSFVSPGPFNIYLTDDYGSTPFSSVTRDQLTINCPFIFSNIPTGTNTLYVKDVNLIYCFTIPIQDNNICQTCNLGLSLYSASTTSVITAGVLTGTCQSSIVDYKINWYGPDDTTTLRFSSGSGEFAPPISTYAHPLSGLGRSIPAIAGVYTPVIENVKINGYSYSNTGGTNNIPASFLGCLPTTNVLPLTCEVRTNTRQDYPYSAYTHFLSLNIASNSQQTITSTFKISADTKYIAWAFAGYERPDRVTITLSGASYGTTQIGLEDIILGYESSLVTNLTPNIYPKSGNTGNSGSPTQQRFYRKITTLTGLTISNNDNIIIKVESSTNNTLWDLYISCLNNWDCDDCVTTNSTRKIIGSSIISTPGDCGYLSINLTVSGCSDNEIKNSDVYTYYGLNQGYNNIDEYTTLYLYNVQLGLGLYGTRFTCGYQNCNNPGAPICTEDSSSTSYDKTFLLDGRGVFGFTGSSQFISSYYNGWINTKSSCWVDGTLPTSIDYYRYIMITIPSNGAPNNCGDFIGTRILEIKLHPTSTIVTGTTGSGQYYMKLTSTTITNQFPTTYGPCDINCTYYLNTFFIGDINNFSTGSTINGYGTNKSFTISADNFGIYYQNSTYCRYFLETNSSSPTSTLTGYFRSSTSIGNTYPFSGTPANNPIPPYTIIPSLSGTVCNYNQSGVVTNSSGYQTFLHNMWEYEARLPNPSNNVDFEIWATPIVNYVLTPPKVLAYRYSGGTVTSNPTYII